ncbi:Exocyst complex component 5 [Savitreella phatthalungensis]
MTSKLYDLDPELEKLLAIDSFEGKFDVRHFVEQLGARQVGLQKRHPGDGFDPKPLIRDFETALTKLQRLQKDVDASIEREDHDTRAAEAQHAKRVRMLSQKFDGVVTTFQKLEDNIGSVGTAPVQLGKDLEALSSQLTRAQAASRVVSTYLSLRENPRALQEQYRGVKVSVEHALFVRNLMQISRDVEIEGSDRTRAVVEAFVETVEQDILAQFEQAREEEDLAGMAHCARVMYEYNGGSSVHRAFVNQHRFFMRNMEADEQLGSNENWQVLPDPDAEIPALEPSVIVLFREVKRVCKNEFPLINRIFPQPATVKAIFLERIFAQLIQQRLEELLHFAENQSTLAYLRTLQTSHEVVGALVDSIKGLSPQETGNDEDDADAQTVSNVLDVASADLFVPYLESGGGGAGRYMDKEKKSLAELYSSVLYKFTRFHQRSSAGGGRGKNTAASYLDRVLTKEGKVGNLMRLAGIERKGSTVRAEDLEEVDITEADGILRPEIVKRMLRWHAEAVGRAMELGSPSDVPKDGATLMQTLIDYVATEYLEVWLDRCLDDVPSPGELRQEPTLTWFGGLRDSTRIAKLLFSYIDLVIVPMAGANLSVKREITARVTSTTKRINGRISAVISRSADLILSWINQLLARQKRSDFIPQDEIDLSQMQTPVGTSVAAFLARVGQAAKDGLLPDSFLADVGVRIQLTMLEHFRRYQVNATGGLLLAKDISQYQRAVDLWGIPALQPRFQLLCDIGSIFIVKPDVLRALVSDGELAGISPRLLLPYLQCREDYTSESIANVLRRG